MGTPFQSLVTKNNQIVALFFFGINQFWFIFLLKVRFDVAELAQHFPLFKFADTRINRKSALVQAHKSNPDSSRFGHHSSAKEI